MYADVGRVQLVVQPAQRANELVERAVRRETLQDLDMAETLAEIQQHIEGLTLGILDFQIEELPMRLQCHIIGVPNRWIRLLHRIARSITCYHEHHQFNFDIFAYILRLDDKCVLGTNFVKTYNNIFICFQCFPMFIAQSYSIM